MGAVAVMTTKLLCNAVPVRVRLLALLLCFQLLHTPSQAFKLRGGVGGYEEKKVPLAVIVPDPTPELSGLSPSQSPLAAPPPVYGGGGDDMRPKLPTERWRRGRGEVRRAAHPPAAHEAPAAAPSSSAAGPARAPAAGAPALDSGSGGGGTASIKSSPAVPVPRGVTDTATILPMPAPGEKRQQEVGAATSVEASCVVVPLLLGLMVMMASFGI